eukprot:m.324607 g.324607  ORF g.324607 m.324607 type:complete len:1635 (+) comp16543_c0_seq2:186-5090(+)
MGCGQSKEKEENITNDEEVIAISTEAATKTTTTNTNEYFCLVMVPPVPHADEMHHQRKLTQLLYDSISKIEDLLLPHKSALKVASTLNSFLDVANEAKNPTESHFHAILWLDTGIDHSKTSLPCNDTRWDSIHADLIVIVMKWGAKWTAEQISKLNPSSLIVWISADYKSSQGRQLLLNTIPKVLGGVKNSMKLNQLANQLVNASQKIKRQDNEVHAGIINADMEKEVDFTKYNKEIAIPELHLVDVTPLNFLVSAAVGRKEQLNLDITLCEEQRKIFNEIFQEAPEQPNVIVLVGSEADGPECCGSLAYSLCERALLLPHEYNHVYYIDVRKAVAQVNYDDYFDSPCGNILVWIDGGIRDLALNSLNSCMKENSNCSWTVLITVQDEKALSGVKDDLSSAQIHFKRMSELSGIPNAAVANELIHVFPQDSSTLLDEESSTNIKEAMEKSLSASGANQSLSTLQGIYRDDTGSTVFSLSISCAAGLFQVRDDLIDGSLEKKFSSFLSKEYEWKFNRTAFAGLYAVILEQLDGLTAHQRNKMKGAEGQQHIHIKGPAGTGKTFIALEMALRPLVDLSEDTLSSLVVDDLKARGEQYVQGEHRTAEFVVDEVLQGFISLGQVASLEKVQQLPKPHIVISYGYRGREKSSRAFVDAFIAAADKKGISVYTGNQITAGVQGHETNDWKKQFLDKMKCASLGTVVFLNRYYNREACEFEWRQSTEVGTKRRVTVTLEPFNSMVDSAALRSTAQNAHEGYKILFVSRNRGLGIYFTKWLLTRLRQRYQISFSDATSIIGNHVYVMYGPSFKISAIKLFQENFETKLELEDVPTTMRISTKTSFDLVIADEAHNILGAEKIEGVRDIVWNAKRTVVLSDDAQSRTSEYALDVPTSHEILLEEVVRNSARIVMASQGFCRDDVVKVSPNSPRGPPLEPFLFNACQNDSERFSAYDTCLKNVFDRLHNDFPGLDLHDNIALLVPNAEYLSHFTEESLNKLYENYNQNIDVVNAITGALLKGTARKPKHFRMVVDSIDEFDGMERMLIIALGLDTARSVEGCSQVYRAMTRAHMKVYVVQEHVVGGWLEWMNNVTLNKNMKPTKELVEEKQIKKNLPQVLKGISSDSNENKKATDSTTTTTTSTTEEPKPTKQDRKKDLKMNLLMGMDKIIERESKEAKRQMKNDLMERLKKQKAKMVTDLWKDNGADLTDQVSESFFSPYDGDLDMTAVTHYDKYLDETTLYSDWYLGDVDDSDVDGYFSSAANVHMPNFIIFNDQNNVGDFIMHTTSRNEFGMSYVAHHFLTSRPDGLSIDLRNGTNEKKNFNSIIEFVDYYSKHNELPIEQLLIPKKLNDNECYHWTKYEFQQWREYHRIIDVPDLEDLDGAGIANITEQDFNLEDDGKKAQILALVEKAKKGKEQAEPAGYPVLNVSLDGVERKVDISDKPKVKRYYAIENLSGGSGYLEAERGDSIRVPIESDNLNGVNEQTMESGIFLESKVIPEDDYKLFVQKEIERESDKVFIIATRSHQEEFLHAEEGDVIKVSSEATFFGHNLRTEKSGIIHLRGGGFRDEELGEMQDRLRTTIYNEKGRSRTKLTEQQILHKISDRFNLDKMRKNSFDNHYLQDCIENDHVPPPIPPGGLSDL